jgi:hypothetical protein
VARAKILGVPGEYTLDWWSPKTSEEWSPVERVEFADVDEPEDVAHLA